MTLKNLVISSLSAILVAGLSLNPSPVFATTDNINIYAELPRTSSVRISPSGRYIAMLSPYKGKKGVFIYDLVDPTVNTRVIPTPKSSLIKYVDWASDKHILMRSETESSANRTDLRGFAVQYSRWYATNIETRKTVLLMDDRIKKNDKLYTVISGGTLTHRLPNDPDHVLMNFPYYTSTFMDGYWKVNLDSGKSRIAKNLPQDTDRAIFSQDGFTLLAREQYDTTHGKLRVYSGDYPDETLVLEESFPTNSNRTTFLRTVSAGKLVIQTEGSSGFDLYTIDPGTKAKGEFDYNVNIPRGYELSPLFAQYTRDLIGVSYTDDLNREAYFAEPYRSWHRRTQKALKGQNVRILSHTQDNKSVTIFAEGKGKPGEYYLFEPELGSISPLGGTYPELDVQSVAKTVRVDYKARDGLDIPAYLTLPPGKTENSKDMSLVVMPHGGPIGVRDDASFDFWAQYLAAQGYAVLKPQFRGSGGFGYTLQKSGDGEFGDAMLLDTIDGVNHLINQGTINEDRICVTGASYGGYQALALPMVEPDMFKCAIAVNGVADIEDMLKYVKKYAGAESGSMRFWHRVMGMEEGGMDRLRAQSPSNNVEKIKAEIILIHGEDDTTVPIQQTKAMAKALKKAGRSDDIIMLKDDDHNLSLASSRMKLLEASDELFAKHLK